MKIALCDDEKIFAAELKKHIYSYANEHNLEPVVDVYISGAALVSAKEKYQIIILDYQMPGLDGLETAKQLRQGENSFACIIFLTSYAEIAIPAYSVDTYRFVLKSTLYDGLYQAFDDYRKGFSEDCKIKVRVNGEILVISSGDIVYIEVQDKICYIYLTDGRKIEAKTGLRDLYSQLPLSYFFRLHKGYVVNFRCIEKRDAMAVYMRGNGARVPVSKNFASRFKEKYYRFLKEQ